MSAWGDVSTSDTLLGVGRSYACAVGRSGESLEAPCWRTISLVASPFASIDTIAAWSNGRPWRWAYSRDASRSARVPPRVLPGISTYPSYPNSWLTRGGIGGGEFDVGVGGGGSVSAGAGAGGVSTGEGDGAATGTDCGVGTSISLGGSVGAARIGVMRGVSVWCQVTSRELVTLPVSASRSR